MQGKRAVVLGGAGFLGSWLCERLLGDGAEKVLAVDNLITGDERNLEGLKKDARFAFL
jgi:dTDP-glucose 4,6-dehydratase